MRVIGLSIIEAIDWTQDTLATTRPLAEQTLFSMLHDKQVRETEAGYVLMEDSEEEVRRIHHGKQVKRVVRRRFHRARKHSQHVKQFTKLHHLDHADAADDMLNPEDNS